ncbi:hypothetical protein [Nocardia cyriacigeorgica]|uniref:hypothetical protein n=1 Tax=Nocardia cyriacigeorgica TaxID=135487 RepID=UPI00245872DB|nr:hypothetical protein [Nocardia cyriacigeorgica]
MTEFIDALSAAKQLDDPDAYIERVKGAVLDELTRLDPSAIVEDTHYFNHSVVPDFVFSWPQGKERRSIYIRDSYASVLASNELSSFNRTAPVILSLSSETEFPSERISVDFDQLRGQMGEHSRTLLTDSTAVAEIDSDTSIRSDSPVQDLIRANFVRGARGVVTTNLAQELVYFDSLPLNADTSRIASRFQEVFSSDVALEMTRAAQLVALATSPEVGGLLGAGKFGLLQHARLSWAELQHLLPWLLQSEVVTPDPQFWRFVGSMMDLSDIEQLKGELADKDLTPLISANLRSWAGCRAYLGLPQYGDGDEFEATVENSLQGRWSFQGGILGVNVLDKRVHVASNGRSLRGRESVSAALWEELKPALAQFRLSTVQLNGIARTITINAAESDNIREDVEEIVRSVEDTYYVSEVRLRLPSLPEGEYTEASVKLGANLVVAQSNVSLFDLLNAAFSVLDYRNPDSRTITQSLDSYSRRGHELE